MTFFDPSFLGPLVKWRWHVCWFVVLLSKPMNEYCEGVKEQDTCKAHLYSAVVDVEVAVR